MPDLAIVLARHLALKGGRGRDKHKDIWSWDAIISINLYRCRLSAWLGINLGP